MAPRTPVIFAPHTPSPTPRSPLPWILAWAVYSLLALAYFAYQSAQLGALCIGSR